MADFGSTTLYSRCVGSVTGILAASYGADTSCDYVKTPDECGEFVQGFTKNVMSTHKWEGEITGASPGGVASANVGQSLAAPSGIYYGNMASPGSALVCTAASYNERRGEWATSSVTGENNAGI